MDLIICDRCGNDIIVEIEERYIKDNITKIYFTCKSCDEEYLIHYTNDHVKRQQQNVLDLSKKYHQVLTVEGNKLKAERVYKQYLSMKTNILQNMDKLEVKINDKGC